MIKKVLLVLLAAGISRLLPAQTPFNGVGSSLSNLYQLSPARSRSISPENFKGAKGGGGMATTGTGAEAARDLGPG